MPEVLRSFPCGNLYQVNLILPLGQKVRISLTKEIAGRKFHEPVQK